MIFVSLWAIILQVGRLYSSCVPLTRMQVNAAPSAPVSLMELKIVTSLPPGSTPGGALPDAGASSDAPPVMSPLASPPPDAGAGLVPGLATEDAKRAPFPDILVVPRRVPPRPTAPGDTLTEGVLEPEPETKTCAFPPPHPRMRRIGARNGAMTCVFATTDMLFVSLTHSRPDTLLAVGSVTELVDFRRMAQLYPEFLVEQVRVDYQPRRFSTVADGRTGKDDTFGFPLIVASLFGNESYPSHAAAAGAAQFKVANSDMAWSYVWNGTAVPSEATVHFGLEQRPASWMPTTAASRVLYPGAIQIVAPSALKGPPGLALGSLIVRATVKFRSTAVVPPPHGPGDAVRAGKPTALVPPPLLKSPHPALERLQAKQKPRRKKTAR